MIRTSTWIHRSTNVFTGKLEFESRSKIQKYDLTVNQVEHLSYIYRCTKNIQKNLNFLHISASLVMRLTIQNFRPYLNQSTVRFRKEILTKISKKLQKFTFFRYCSLNLFAVLL